MSAPPPPAAATPTTAPSTQRERRNWLIYTLYCRQEFKECLGVIDAQLAECGGQAEYPLYVKALIHRQRGEIQESLQLFQRATILNPANTLNLKQVARSLFLLGKHRAAIDVYDDALKENTEDWEIWHNKGLCAMYLKDYEKAVTYFQNANAISQHDATYMQLGRVYILQDRLEEAIEVYTEALDFSPDNPELLTTIGLQYLRLGDQLKAFDYLGNALTLDPRNPKTILAAGSIIQDHNDIDVALIKYRIAAIATPNSAQLWNNIGMCFFRKRKFVAAIACLKRAHYLAPFEWIVAYNLGLAHLHTQQYASAFHFFSGSINLKPDFASSYMYLGMTLFRLDDFENATVAFNKSLEMQKDFVAHLNYAIILQLHGDNDAALQQFLQFEDIFSTQDEEVKNSDPDILEQRRLLSEAFGMSATKPALPAQAPPPAAEATAAAAEEQPQDTPEEQQPPHE